jgi:hypothetical protein
VWRVKKVVVMRRRKFLNARRRVRRDDSSSGVTASEIREQAVRSGRLAQMDKLGLGDCGEFANWGQDGFGNLAVEAD